MSIRQKQLALLIHAAILCGKARTTEGGKAKLGEMVDVEMQTNGGD